MPEPIPFPKPTAPAPPSSADQPSTAPQPPPPSRTSLTGWRLALFVIVIGAVVLRLLLFLFAHVSTHHAATLPTWPLHNGDVLTLTPGDANIAKWAQNPLATGFVVQQLESAGQPVTGTKICALEPDYMADAQQPGGVLTLLDQQPTGDWRVHWAGGDTLPPFIKQKGDFDANCGTNTIVLMTPGQLHSFLDILGGVADYAPPATNATPPPPSK